MNNDHSGLRLLKKGKQNFFRALFSRVGLILLFLIIQIFVLFSLFHWFEGIIPYFWGGSTLFSTVMVIHLINSNLNPTVKITWLVIMMSLPVFGILIYIYTISELGHRIVKSTIERIDEDTSDYLSQDQEIVDQVLSENAGIASLVNYVKKTGQYQIYKGTEVTYFPSGEDKWKEMLVQLEKAEKYIYLEYFIIEEGLMWGRILEILARKAQEGLDVRVMYDGMCALTVLPGNYPQRIKKLGIKCKMFSPVRPFVSTHYNYRDHRKILVIDGKVAFNGGVNLADEYINEVDRFGHWKDAAIMLKGEAVKGFTNMFLKMWAISENETDFKEIVEEAGSESFPAKGFVMPYGDNPFNEHKVGERIYMDILNRATKYVYIMTPYLILDGEMETALRFAAERGVEVSLIIPGIPDKKVAYALAKTHYKRLLKSGIHLYEYSPGFVHAKVFLSDDREAVVGTINLDYRSLYHHFECASYLYGVDCIKDIKKDFIDTREKCKKVTSSTIQEEKIAMKIIGFVTKFIAPMM